MNHYSAPDDPSCDFADLLAQVNDIDGVERIRFASPHPRHTGARLIEAVRDLPKVCKHFHLPVQSGSTRILRAMRRRHTREQYLDLIQQIRESIPDITLSTDVIVGFPGETAEDFEDTLSLTSAARYHSMFSFKYSPRPNTLASNRMPDDVERRREDRAHRRAAVAAAADTDRSFTRPPSGRWRRFSWTRWAAGSCTKCLGRTGGNTVVSLPVPSDTTGNTPQHAWIGRTVPVRITRAGPHSLWGEAVSA